jgi:hypothetical protein
MHSRSSLALPLAGEVLATEYFGEPLGWGFDTGRDEAENGTAASSVPLGKRHRGSRLRLRCRPRLRMLVGMTSGHATRTT